MYYKWLMLDICSLSLNCLRRNMNTYSTFGTSNEAAASVLMARRFQRELRVSVAAG